MTATLSALPTRVDLRLYAGDDLTVKVNVNNPDGTPADLTGASAKAQIRVWAYDADPIAEFTCAVDPSGFVLLGLDAASTALLPRSSVWDCELLFDAGSPTTTIVSGSIRTLAEVTR
jgi:hypothetical protein